MESLLIETCCSTFEDALESVRAGIRRIELNSALALGGLTASISLLKKIKLETNLSVMAMLRPREGGMAYRASEYQIMEYDLESLVDAGADGVVFGILQDDGSIDLKRTEKLRLCLGHRDAVFHRGFDLTPDPHEALEQLILLGFTRVLTSGQQPTVLQGESLLTQLKVQARGRITILPGGGLRADHVLPFVQRTGFHEIHFTPRKARKDASASAKPEISFGLPGFSHDLIFGDVDGEKLTDIIRQYHCEEFQ
jgi:copper homeostasis protein